MFNDAVPCEGLQRTQVLTRIGIMSLIRKKVGGFKNQETPYFVITFYLLLADPKTDSDTKMDVDFPSEKEDPEKDNEGKENNDNKSDETEPMDVRETGEKSSEDGKDGEQKKPMFEAEEKEDDRTVDTADKKKNSDFRRRKRGKGHD